MPYAAVINLALEFCTTMLTRSSVLYPFAVFSEEDQNHSIFIPSDNQYAGSDMIEALQSQIDERRTHSENGVSVMVYCASVSHPNQVETDALILTITDSDGHNTVTVYPYQNIETGLKISAPYTCDFPD